MMDQETLRPVIIAMALYILMAKFARHMRPTGLQPVDDVTSMMIANEGNVLGGVVMVGLITLAANLINERF